MNATIGMEIQSRFHRWIFQDHRKPWVARIVGRDPRYDLSRSFVESKADYSEMDKKGRGLKHWFVLEPGIYEICRPLPKQLERRYFARVMDDGTLTEISKEEAMAGLEMIFEPIDARTVWKQFGVRAKLEGIDVYPSGKTPVEWWCLRSGDDILAIYGLMPIRKITRLKGIYVRPDQRGKGIGRAIIKDAMSRAEELEALAYKPEAYLAAGWRAAGEKPTKLGLVTTVRWSREKAD